MHAWAFTSELRSAANIPVCQIGGIIWKLFIRGPLSTSSVTTVSRLELRVIVFLDESKNPFSQSLGDVSQTAVIFQNENPKSDHEFDLPVSSINRLTTCWCVNSCVWRTLPCRMKVTRNLVNIQTWVNWPNASEANCCSRASRTCAWFHNDCAVRR